MLCRQPRLMRHSGVVIGVRKEDTWHPAMSEARMSPLGKKFGPASESCGIRRWCSKAKCSSCTTRRTFAQEKGCHQVLRAKEERGGEGGGRREEKEERERGITCTFGRVFSICQRCRVLSVRNASLSQPWVQTPQSPIPKYRGSPV